MSLTTILFTMFSSTLLVEAAKLGSGARSRSRLVGGGIAGVVIGIIVVVVLVCIVILVLIRRRKRAGGGRTVPVMAQTGPEKFNGNIEHQQETGMVPPQQQGMPTQPEPAHHGLMSGVGHNNHNAQDGHHMGMPSTNNQESQGFAPPPGPPPTGGAAAEGEDSRFIGGFRNT